MSRRFLFGVVLLIAFTFTHLYVTQLPSTATSPLMFVDRLFDLAFVLLLNLSFLGVGKVVLGWLAWQGTLAESTFWAFGIGAGCVSFSLLFLGFGGLLYAPVLLIFLIGILWIGQEEIQKWLAEIQLGWARRVRLSRVESALFFVLVLLISPALLSALLPPTDVDALVYQLVGPALFLQNHFVFAAFDNIGINYPLGLPMLFSFGLAVNSEIAAQLIHFSFALALTLGIYTLATGYATRVTGLLAVIVFWTSPVVGLEASAPLLDLGWVFYEFLAVYAFLRWRNTRKLNDLILAGISMGFALSNKYLAAIGLLVLALALFYEMVRTEWARPRMIVRNLFAFGAATIIIAAPWYLKNLIWLSNPVYPFFFGAYGFDGILHKPAGTLGLDGWIGYGVGNGLIALIQFPINVYWHWEAFSAAYNRGGPSWLFVFLPFFLFLPKRIELKGLALFCVIRFTFWWFFTQNIRYLLVIFPFLAISAAWVIVNLTVRIPRARQVVISATILGCVVGVLLQWGFAVVLRDLTFPFLSGQVSRAVFLSANLRDYASVQFMNTQLPVDAKILAIGNARTFYARRTVIIDDGKDNWLKLRSRVSSLDAVVNELQQMGITHLWVSADDLVYMENYWDPDGIYQKAVPELMQFTSLSLEKLYLDDHGYAIYAVPVKLNANK